MDEFRLNQQKRTQTPQHTLPARAFQSAKHAQLHSSSPKKGAYHRHFSISRMKPISISILFSEHALLCAYLVLCGLCNPIYNALTHIFHGGSPLSWGDHPFGAAPQRTERPIWLGASPPPPFISVPSLRRNKKSYLPARSMLNFY